MFEIWHYSKCIKVMTLDEVNEKYHSMGLGQSIMLNDEIWIVRIK